MIQNTSLINLLTIQKQSCTAKLRWTPWPPPWALQGQWNYAVTKPSFPWVTLSNPLTTPARLSGFYWVLAQENTWLLCYHTWLLLWSPPKMWNNAVFAKLEQPRFRFINKHLHPFLKICFVPNCEYTVEVAEWNSIPSTWVQQQFDSAKWLH